MDMVTRHILRLQLLLPCQTVLLEPFKVLSGEMWYDKTRNKLWGGSTNASLNRTFLWIIDFFLVSLALLNWRVDFLAVYLSFICLISAPDTFAMKG